MFDRYGLNDALNTDNYILEAIEPPSATIRLIQWIERVDDVTVRLLFDGELDAGATYRITAQNITTAFPGCLGLDPTCSVCQFDGLIPERPGDAITKVDEDSTDVSNPQLPADRPNGKGPLGTFQITDRGDYANEDNPEYLRKRVIRRATTGMGAFFHLPTYGFGEPLKGPLTPSVLRRIQARAIKQIREERDVLAAQVRVRQISEARPGIIVLEIRIQTTDGRSHDFTAPLDYGGD